MKKFFVISLVILSLLVAKNVYAIASIDADVYVSFSDTGSNQNGNGLLVGAAGVFGSCAPTETVYMKINLTNALNELGATTVLTLTYDPDAASSSSNTGNVVFYEVADDSWVEGDVNGSAPPVLGSQIASVANNNGSGTLQLMGSNFASYLNQESTFTGDGDLIAGDNIASLAFQIEDCTDFFADLAVFDDSEEIGGTPPSISLFTPTAVHMTDIGISNNSAINWIWATVAGIFVLVTGFLYMRERRQESEVN